VVGDEAVPESLIADQVRELNEALGQPPGAPNAPAAVAAVGFNVIYELVEQAAQDAGVVVPPGAVDRAYDQLLQQGGGEDRLRVVAAGQGVPFSALRRDVEVQLQAGALANLVAPNAPQQQQQQLLLAELGRAAEELGVDVAPKYGTWDPATLQVAPPTAPVSRVAQPESPGGLTGLPPQ
jgi:hypothetical protein